MTSFIVPLTLLSLLLSPPLHLPNRSERMEFLFEFLFSPLPTSALVFLFGLGAVALTYLNTRPKPLRPPVDLNRQTVGIVVRACKTECSNMIQTCNDTKERFSHDDIKCYWKFNYICKQDNYLFGHFRIIILICRVEPENVQF